MFFDIIDYFEVWVFDISRADHIFSTILKIFLTQPRLQKLFLSIKFQQISDSSGKGHFRSCLMAEKKSLSCSPKIIV